MSRALARLQSDLGVPLFRRAGRSHPPDHATANCFLARVERALGEIDNGRRELADFKAADRGAVSLGFLRTLGAHIHPGAGPPLQRWSSRAVRFAFVQNNSTAVEAQLERGELDLIFVAVPPGHAGFDWTRVGDQEFVLIVPRSHRLARPPAGEVARSGRRTRSCRSSRAMRSAA